MDQKNIPVAQMVPAKTAIYSKTRLGKAASEVSMTPSQMAAAEAARARKHPLDALSRTVYGRNLEKRSGLQDVDDAFLKQNPYAKVGYGRHTGLNDGNLYAAGIQNQPAAGQPSGMALNAMNSAAMQQQQQIAMQPPPAEGQPPIQYIPVQMVPQQQIQQQPIMQQQPPLQQANMQQQLSQPAVQNAVPMSQPGGLVNPGQPLQPVVQPSYGQQVLPTPTNPVPNNVPQNIQQVAPPQQQQQQQQNIQQIPQQQIPQQQISPPAATTPPEPDLCTTCPNCQTTIYLFGQDVPQAQQMQKAAS